MSRFLDTHTVPGVNREAIFEACKAMQAAPGVTFVACHYDLGEGKVFCLTEAESEDVCARLTRTSVFLTTASGR